MNIYSYDIETVISDEGKKLVQGCDIQAPANYKDPEKISAYIEEKRKDLFDKAALYWWTGKIVCISAYNIATNEPYVVCADDEKEILSSFFKYLKDNNVEMLVGKNSEEFDDPWVRARAMRHDLGLVSVLRLSRPFSDVQKIFGYSRSSSQVTSLKNMGEALELKTKKSGDGGEVGQLWKDGKRGELMEYCLNDSKMVAEIWQRYMKEF